MTWLLISIAVTTLYRYMSHYYDGWTPTELSRIDIGYSVTQILLVAIILVNILSFIVREIEHSILLDRAGVKRFFPLIKAIVFTVIWVVAFFYVLEALLINTTSILTGAGIWGAILALAMKDIFTNLLGSLSILLSRTFEIGDTIRVRTHSTIRYEGIVEEITLNYIKITNMTGEVVFMPNRLIYTETVENLSRRRFVDYVYKIPFNKQLSTEDVQTRLRIIEGKIEAYSPIDVLYETEVPNAVDFVYKITVLMPEENRAFDQEIQHFLIDYIFQSKKPHNDIPDLQK